MVRINSGPLATKSVMKRRLVAIAVLLCCASCGSKTEPAKRVYSAAEALSEAVLLLSNGKQDEAEALLREEVPRHADDQRLALLRRLLREEPV